MADETKDKGNKRKVKSGDVVNLVTAKLKRIPAKVTRVRDDGCVDVLAVHDGQEHTICRCPCDPDAKTTDSWHPAGDEPDAETKPAA